MKRNYKIGLAYLFIGVGIYNSICDGIIAFFASIFISFLPAFFLLREKDQHSVTTNKWTTFKKVLKGFLYGSIILFLLPMNIGGILKHIVRTNTEAELANLRNVEYVDSTETNTELKEKNEFARFVEWINKDCPVTITMGMGVINSVKLEDNDLTYYVSYDDKLAPFVSKLKSNSKMKEAFITSTLCVNAQNDLLLSKLEQLGYGIKLNITLPSLGLFEFHISADELKAIRKKNQRNPQEAQHNLLLINTEIGKQSVPIEIDKGVVMTDYSLKGENIIITLELDEDIYSMETLRQNKAFLESNAIDNLLQDALGKNTLKMCKACNIGLIYRYQGNKSKETLEIKIPKEEILSIDSISRNS